MQPMTTWIPGFWPWPHRPERLHQGYSAVLFLDSINCRFTPKGLWLFVGGRVLYGLGVSHPLSPVPPLQQRFAALPSSHPGFGFVFLLSFLTVVWTLGTVGTTACYVFLVFLFLDISTSSEFTVVQSRDVFTWRELMDTCGNLRPTMILVFLNADMQLSVVHSLE